MSADTLVLMNEWRNVYCSGPPVALYTFSVSDPFALSPNANLSEVWPYMYEYMSPESPIGYCAYMFPGLIPTDACCESSIFPAETVFGSVSYDYIGTDSDHIVSKYANGHQYCQINAAGNDSLYGYSSLSVLQGECIEGIQCAAANIMIYNNTECTGTFETVPITSSLSIATTIIGDIQIQSTVINNAKQQTIWLAEMPQENLVPYFQRPLDYVMGFFTLLSMLALIGCVAYFIKRIMKKPNISNSIFLLQVTTWLVYFSLFISYVYAPLETYSQVVALGGSFEIIKNFATYIVAFTTTLLIVHILALPTRVRIGTFVVLTVVHLGLSGYKYLQIYWLENPTVTQYGRWGDFLQYWYIFMFLFSMAPFALYLYIIIKPNENKKLRNLSILISQDIGLTLLFVGFLLNLGFFLYFSNVLLYNPIIMGGDRMTLTYLVLKDCTLALQAVLQCLATDHIKVLFAMKKDLHTVAPKEKPLVKLNELAPIKVAAASDVTDATVKLSGS
ncbi:hypothetical protein HDV06_001569 [Boothiomyces sp. JEL0866]|nr:hypothetical protein HDV06_001569 [Boothiomyces sp. JEL0866]